MNTYPTRPVAKNRLHRSGYVLLYMFLTALFFSTAPVSHAATITDRPFLFSIDGSNATAGRFSNIQGMDFDQTSGILYVLDAERVLGQPSQDALDKFDAEGNALDFSTGSSSLFPNAGLDNGNIAVDNSNVNPGRIYVIPKLSADPVVAFSPSGERLWSLSATNPQDGSVDSSGHLWLLENGVNRLREFASIGSPPGQIFSFSLPNQGTFVDIDKNGNLYVTSNDQSLRKYSVSGEDLGLIDPGPVRAQTLDSGSGGHIFTINGPESIREFDSAGTLLHTYDAGLFQSGGAAGISYNSTLDRLYVADSRTNVVKVFGPPITATVPDVVAEPPIGEGLFMAVLQGKINPHEVPNQYFFEWKKGVGGSWVDAKSSTVESVAEDQAEHTVSTEISGLEAATSYQVRLVGVNSEKRMTTVSPAITFTTPTPAPPTVTMNAVTDVTSTSAHVSGVVDPHEDETEWRVELQKDCTGAYAPREGHSIPQEETTGLNVESTVEELLPNQLYCARIVAANGGGSTESIPKSFTTAAVPPGIASAAFAGPRLDTAARLNARVNPEGSNLTYRFELSDDGGVTWQLMPARVDETKARTSVVISDEVVGLTPDSAYMYRLAEVMDSAGPSPSLGDAKTFKTRRIDEVQGPGSCPNDQVRSAQRVENYLGQCRAVELVNNPDVGNQSVRIAPGASVSSVSSTGESVLWNTFSGAPEAPNGTANTFLARRGNTGWVSNAIAPPAAEQLGGGGLSYSLAAETPSFETSIFAVGLASGLSSAEPAAMVRVSKDQKEEPLKVLGARFGGNDLERVDVTEDGQHVVMVDPATNQLEDLGEAKIGPPQSVGEILSIMPDGDPSSCGLNSESLSFFGPPNNEAKAAAVLWRQGYHRMSVEDASRVYFEARPNSSVDPTQCDSSSPYGIYLRDRISNTTTLIDAGVGSHDPEIIRTTPDGSRVFFVTYSQLDSLDSNASGDIYQWSSSSDEAHCLTCLVGDAHVTTGVVGTVLISNDFSHIYFVSGAQLVNGQGTVSGANLYSLHQGIVTFIGDVGKASLLGGTEPAEVSADGNSLVFRADASRTLTSDVVQSECNVPSSLGEIGNCVELYRYDDRVQSVECLSCSQVATTSHSFGASSEVERIDFKVSSDGSTIAFSTQEDLVEGDTNLDTDIYEWQTGGFNLLTDGIGKAQAGLVAPQVLGVGADGRDIILGVVPTGGSLTGFEQSALLNIYDARVNGGFIPSAVSSSACNDDACQGGGLGPPPPVVPASSTYRGTGNLPGGLGKQAKNCSKPKAVRQGKCRHHRKHKSKRSGHGHSKAKGDSKG